MIRAGTVADAAAIGPLFQGVQGLHAAHLPTIFKQPTASDNEVAWLAQVLAAPSAFPLVAEIDAQVVGYLIATEVRREESIIRRAHRYFILEHIAVAPPFQQQGVGANLMQALFAAAAERQIARIELEVWNFNEKAERFFARHGFSMLSQRMEVCLPAV